MLWTWGICLSKFFEMNSTNCMSCFHFESKARESNMFQMSQHFVLVTLEPGY